MFVHCARNFIWHYSLVAFAQFKQHSSLLFDRLLRGRHRIGASGN